VLRVKAKNGEKLSRFTNYERRDVSVSVGVGEE